MFCDADVPSSGTSKRQLTKKAELNKTHQEKPNLEKSMENSQQPQPVPSTSDEKATVAVKAAPVKNGDWSLLEEEEAPPQLKSFNSSLLPVPNSQPAADSGRESVALVQSSQLLGDAATIMNADIQKAGSHPSTSSPDQSSFPAKPVVLVPDASKSVNRLAPILEEPPGEATEKQLPQKPSGGMITDDQRLAGGDQPPRLQVPGGPAKSADGGNDKSDLTWRREARLSKSNSYGSANSSESHIASPPPLFAVLTSSTMMVSYKNGSSCQKTQACCRVCDVA